MFSFLLERVGSIIDRMIYVYVFGLRVSYRYWRSFLRRNRAVATADTCPSRTDSDSAEYPPVSGKSNSTTGGHKVVLGGVRRTPADSDSVRWTVRQLMSDTDNFVSASVHCGHYLADSLPDTLWVRQCPRWWTLNLSESVRGGQMSDVATSRNSSKSEIPMIVIHPIEIQQAECRQHFSKHFKVV